MVTSSFALPTKPKLPSTKSDPILTESDQQPVSVLTQPFRSPSFRDLQRSCAYLQGRLADALTANEALTQDNEALRSQAREEAAFMGRLAQDAASAEQSQRTAERVPSASPHGCTRPTSSARRSSATTSSSNRGCLRRMLARSG